MGNLSAQKFAECTRNTVIVNWDSQILRHVQGYLLILITCNLWLLKFYY